MIWRRDRWMSMKSAESIASWNVIFRSRIRRVVQHFAAADGHMHVYVPPGFPQDPDHFRFHDVGPKGKESCRAAIHHEDGVLGGKPIYQAVEPGPLYEAILVHEIQLFRPEGL